LLGRAFAQDTARRESNRSQESTSNLDGVLRREWEAMCQNNCPDWWRELEEQWASHRERLEREQLLAQYESQISKLTEREQESLFEALADL
jgi:hypothetical protein